MDSTLGLAFNDKSPLWLILQEAVYLGLAFSLLGVAYKAKSEWVRAGLATLGLAVLAWHVLAIVPSWWLYYADGVLGLGRQRLHRDRRHLPQTVGPRHHRGRRERGWAGGCSSSAS